MFIYSELMLIITKNYVWCFCNAHYKKGFGKDPLACFYYQLPGVLRNPFTSVNFITIQLAG
ncbi:hypothetical protein DM680_26215 [Salmonella enterica subsp. diarizonae]|nr:hypothetical protein [Salmonella enterica subsp. diarizonae]